MNEKDIDYIPVTDNAQQCTKDVMDLKDSVESKELTELHCKVFMERAFPPEKGSKTYSNTQKKSGSILACRLQAEMDYIVYVIKNWQVGVEAKFMANGIERDELLAFCCQHHNGNKYIHQYHIEDIEVPGITEPCTIIRRINNGKIG